MKQLWAVYAPTSSLRMYFCNTCKGVTRALERIDRKKKLCHMGDLNIYLFKSESFDYTGHFIEQFFTSFFPLITKATQVKDKTETLIHNIFMNNLEKLNDSINDIVFNDISDHLTIIHEFNTDNFVKNKNTNEDTLVTYKREYNENNINAFKGTVKNLCKKEMKQMIHFINIGPNLAKKIQR